MHIRRILRNLENGASSGGSGAGTPAAGGSSSAGAGAGTPAAASAAAASSPAAAAPASAPAAAPASLSAEVQQAIATAVAAAVKPPAAGTPSSSAPAGGGEAATIAAATSAAMFEMGLSSAGLTPEQTSIVRTLFGAEKPAPDKMADWMKAKLVAFGKAPAAAPPAQSGVRADLGAPGARPTDPNALPADPRLIKPELWRGMTSEQRLKITRDWRASQGGAGLMRNPNRK